MANGFQRLVYNLANVVPLVVMTALAWYIEFGTWRIPVTLLAAAVVVTVLFVVPSGTLLTSPVKVTVTDCPGASELSNQARMPVASS